MTPPPNTAAREWALTAPAAAVTGVVERLPEWETLDADRFPDAVNMAKLFQSSGLAYCLDKLAEAMRDGWPEDPDECATAKVVLDVMGRCPVTEDGLSALAVVHRVSPLRVDAANTRDDPIMPGPLVMVRPSDPRAGKVYARAAHASRHSGEVLYFPGFGPDPEDGPATPALPLALYDLGGGEPNTRGRGAPLALRIFVESVLAVPSHARNPDRVAMLPPERVRDWLARIYPDTKSYRPAKHWPRIKSAIDALNSWDARVPWEHPDGGGALRQVVIAHDVPRQGRANDWIRFGVHLPPGATHGALVDRPALRLAGVTSGPAYRLALSLSFEWHRPGATRQPLRRGGAVVHWRQVRDPTRYPALTDDTLMSLGVPLRVRYTAQRRRHRPRCPGIPRPYRVL